MRFWPNIAVLARTLAGCYGCAPPWRPAELEPGEWIDSYALAAVVRGHHAEPAVARRKVVVERLPPIADVLPIAIEAFEFVFEPVLLRRNQAERGIVDLK